MSYICNNQCDAQNTELRIYSCSYAALLCSSYLNSAFLHFTVGYNSGGEGLSWGGCKLKLFPVCLLCFYLISNKRSCGKAKWSFEWKREGEIVGHVSIFNICYNSKILYLF
jgi:hypothetical protein